LSEYLNLLACYDARVNPGLFAQPFFQVTLPLMVTFVATVWIAQWSQNKRFDDLRSEMNRRFDDLNKRIDEILKRLDRIEQKLDAHENRITRLEERTSPFAAKH